MDIEQGLISKRLKKILKLIKNQTRQAEMIAELYKYQPINTQTIDNLIKCQIFFNTLRKVNDPFETALLIDLDKTKFFF